MEKIIEVLTYTMDTVMAYFGVSTKVAKEYLELLNDKQYRDLKDNMKLGGKDNG